MRPRDLAEYVNGEMYFTVKWFARVTMRSEQNVRYLMARGNRIRRLKVVRIFDKPMIPYSEMLEFPFTTPGRGSKVIYHYDEDGRPIVEGEEVHSG